GLIEAVMPNAASKASYPQLLNKIMDKIKSANPNIHKYFMDKNPKTCSRALFEVDRGCEAIKNDFNECFNNVIVNVRHKPLLTMLEAIRVIVLERKNKMREISRRWNPGVLACNTCWWEFFEVRSESEGFTVDEGKRTCSYRMWQLSGLPFVHATKVIFLINRVPESYVPAWFETDMYFVAHHNYVKPVLVMNFWPDQSMYSTVLPSKPRKMLGKPRKKIIKSMGEGGSLTRLSKRGPVRDEKAGRSRGGARGSRGRGGVAGSRGGASVLRGVVGGSRRGSSMSGDACRSTSRGAGGSSGASGSRGRGVGRSGGASGSRGRGAGGSKRKPMSTAGIQKR
ncbi:hypothetical protein Tco_1490011, partial [Tanacetum coccineum]